MKKLRITIRIALLIYILILLPFFYNTTPIRFLLIDSFLAYVPIELYFAIEKMKNTKYVYPLGFLYVLFLPNNLYLLTDLIHLRRIPFYSHSTQIMSENSFNWLMFSLVIIGVFGLVLIGFQTEIETVHQLRMCYKFPFWFYIVIQLSLFIAVSCGVFLGRFIRLNSIQLLTNAPLVLVDVASLFTLKGIFFVGLFTLIQLIFWLIVKGHHYLISANNE